MIRWAALLVVASDALIIRFVQLHWAALYGVRFGVAALAMGILIAAGTPRESFGLSFADFRRDAKWTIGCATLFLTVFLAAALAGLFAMRLGWVRPDVGANRDFWDRDSALHYALSGLLLAPVVEEMIYRGLVVPWLKPAFPRWGVIAASGLIFYALHLAYGRPYWMVHYVAAGAILAWAFLSTGKLWVPMALHALGNVLMAADDALLLWQPQWLTWLLTAGR